MRGCGQRRACSAARKATYEQPAQETHKREQQATVKRDARGNVAQVEVKKGIIFRKTIAVPPDRIAAVESANEPSNNTQATGKVIVAASEPEIDNLSATGGTQKLFARPSDTVRPQQPL